MRFTQIHAPKADGSGGYGEVHAKVVKVGGEDIKQIPEPVIATLLAKGKKCN